MSALAQLAGEMCSAMIVSHATENWWKGNELSFTAGKLL